MFLRSCLNPVEITLHGEKKYVPCGKCEFCMNIRNYERSLRAQILADQYKYCVFGTLTYSDLFLPKMLYDDKNRYLYVPQSNDFIFANDSNEIGDIYRDLYLSPKDEFFVLNTQKQLGYLPRLSRSDAKLYFKRVRITFNRKYEEYCKQNNLNYEPIKIQNTYCGEYGPTCYRPHFHFLLFFNEKWIADNMEILRSCWSFGRCDFKLTTSSNHLRYVTQYLNSSYNLPSCYQCRKVRPFVVVSKIKYSSLSEVSKDSLRKLFFAAAPTMSYRFRNKVGYQTITLLSTLKNRLFPQFAGYKFLTHRQRVELFEFAAKSQNYLGLVYSFVDYSQKFPYSFLASYFDYFYKPTEKYNNAIYSLFLSSRKVVENMHLFCIDSIEDYVTKIDDFLNNCDMYNLKQQLKYENSLPSVELVKYVDMSNYVNNDLPLISNRVESFKSSRLRTHKNKRKNEYLALHPEYQYIHDYDDFNETFIINNNLIKYE